MVRDAGEFVAKCLKNRNMQQSRKDGSYRRSWKQRLSGERECGAVGNPGLGTDRTYREV